MIYIYIYIAAFVVWLADQLAKAFYDQRAERAAARAFAAYVPKYKPLEFLISEISPLASKPFRRPRRRRWGASKRLRIVRSILKRI